MNAPTPDPIREAAQLVFDRVHMGPQDFRPADLEEVLRSALPTLASLLGELGVLRDRLMVASAWIDDRVAPWGYTDADAREFNRDRDHVVELARSALSGDAGRLAGEVIRAAYRLATAQEAGDHSLGGEVHPILIIGLAKAVRAVVSASNALLAAHPEIRGEVGNG